MVTKQLSRKSDELGITFKFLPKFSLLTELRLTDPKFTKEFLTVFKLFTSSGILLSILQDKFHKYSNEKGKVSTFKVLTRFCLLITRLYTFKFCLLNHK